MGTTMDAPDGRRADHTPGSPTDMIDSTIFELAGVTTDADTRLIKDRLYDVPEVGGVSFELVDGGARVILKHKAAVAPDREAVAAAVRAAGDFDLA